MYEAEILKYKSLNQLAEASGTVILGGSGDVSIPLGELKQAFALNENIYNRSFSSLSVTDAAKVFDECIAELYPDTVILHIGEADAASFEKKGPAFEESYKELIGTITSRNQSCRVVIVSLKKYGNDPNIAKINKCLKNIADSKKCEFEDISAKHVLRATEKREVISFLYNIGFDRPLNIKRPIYDLVRILFCYEG